MVNNAGVVGAVGQSIRIHDMTKKLSDVTVYVVFLRILMLYSHWSSEPFAFFLY